MGNWCTSPSNNVKEGPKGKKKGKKDKKGKNRKQLETYQKDEETMDSKAELLNNPFKRPAALSNPQEVDGHNTGSE